MAKKATFLKMVGVWMVFTAFEKKHILKELYFVPVACKLLCGIMRLY